MKQMSLLDWCPSCQIMAFPLASRIGKIRDVAAKMSAKASARHADAYRDQVTSALLNHFDRLGIPECEQDEQLGAFWNAVHAEMGRRPRTPIYPNGGNAA